MAWIFLWLYLKNAKKLDDYRDESKLEEERIRNRFQIVIDKYDTEKEALLKERLDSLVQLKNAIMNLKELNDDQKKLQQESLNELKELKTRIKLIGKEK